MGASDLSPYAMSVLSSVEPDMLLKIALERKGVGVSATAFAQPPSNVPANPWAMSETRDTLAPPGILPPSAARPSRHSQELQRAEYEMFGPDAERGPSPERIDATGSFSQGSFDGRFAQEALDNPREMDPRLQTRFEALQSQIGTLRSQIEVLVNRDRDKDDRINECLSILRAMQNTHGMMGA